MNTLLANQLGELVNAPSGARDVLYEHTMRVAAGTLRRSDPDEVSATTVVGVVGADDMAAFESLVYRIAEDSGVEPQIRLRGDVFSVRFSRPTVAPTAAPRRNGLKARLRELLRG